MRIGYARVSTTEQDNQLQIEALIIWIHVDTKGDDDEHRTQQAT